MVLRESSLGKAGRFALRGQGLPIFLSRVPQRPQRDAVRSPFEAFEVRVRRLPRPLRDGKKRLQSKRADLVDREDLFAGAAFGKFSHDLLSLYEFKIPRRQGWCSFWRR
jgi:hypothetical protein